MLTIFHTVIPIQKFRRTLIEFHYITGISLITENLLAGVMEFRNFTRILLLDIMDFCYITEIPLPDITEFHSCTHSVVSDFFLHRNSITFPGLRYQNNLT